MKPSNFDYARPASLDQVFALLDEHGDGARLLAGGQSLMPTLNMRLSSPDILIDINRIADLDGVDTSGDVLRIGALTRHATLERSDVIADKAPLLAAAIRHVAHPAIRNRGTIGGSIALADPAAELPACLLALDATIVLRSKDGARRVPASDFFIDLYETARAENEIVEAIELSPATDNMRFGFDELARRHGDFAIVGLAAAAAFDGDTVTSLKLAFFGVGNKAVLAEAASKAVGHDLSDARIAEIAEAVAGELDPNDDLQASAGMRRHLASVLTGRVLRKMQDPRKMKA